MNKLVLIALLVLITAIFPHAFWVGCAISIVWFYFGHLAVQIIRDDEDIPLVAVGFFVLMGLIGFIFVALVAGAHGAPVGHILKKEIPILARIKFQSPIVLVDEDE